MISPRRNPPPAARCVVFNLMSFPYPSCPNLRPARRSKMKREVRAAFERRAIREALEKRIREVLRTPPRDRSPEQLALLSEHAAVVAPLMANLERSLRRKTQTEERLDEREDPREVMLEAVAVLVKMIKEHGSFVLHTGAGRGLSLNSGG
jgi:hypothetical protein